MTSPRILLSSHGVYAKKQLGQHFLSDPSTADMIIDHSGISPEDIVLEIGAGLGALTIPLACTAEKVYAVEKDHRIIELLKTELHTLGLSNVVLIEKNILKVDIKTLAENATKKIIVIGNLPYSISSQILIQLINTRKSVNKAILMFQKELAQRITAQPDCKDYGRLTVMLRYCADIKRLAEVKASLFFPRPKVDSEVLEIIFNNIIKYPAKDELFLFKVIKAAFSKRRKTLKNSLLGSELHMDAKTVVQVLENADIDPSRRAETLTVQEFVKLSNCLGDVIPIE
ncbi:MAG: 16S rRNA (adenine(1518)-N(6)/adenine(1519)-N(6))-dimethyltransferase RsmA [Desulfobacterales bacterium]